MHDPEWKPGWRPPAPARGLDPFTGPLLASFIIEGLLAVGAGALPIATFNAIAGALTNVIGFGILGAAASLAGGQRKPQIRPPESQKQSYELEDGPRIIVLGRARVGGVFALRASTGFDTYRLLAQCQGPVDGIEEYFVKDREVTVDFNGEVSSPPYAYLGGSYLSMFTKLGTADQTAFSQLTSAFPSQWTSDHRLRGLLATTARFTSPGTNDPKFLKIWPEGYPTFDLLVRGERMYDPRLDSTTANGSGSQRADDDETWAWSDNGVLGVLWHCTASPDKGGFGLSFDKFDLDDIAVQADLADAAQDSKAGVGAEKRSKISGSYTTDTQRADVLANILLSTGCNIVRLQNGKMSIHLEDDNPAPTVTVRRQNIISTVYGGDEIVTDANSFKLQYLSPERQWQLAEVGIEGKSWAEDADSIAATGKRPELLTLNFCPQPGQAQRIARRTIAKRRAMRGEIKTNLAGLMTMGHLHGTVELDVLEDGYHPNVDFGSGRLAADGRTVSIPLIFRPTLSAWDVEADEAPAPVPLEDIQFSGDLDTPTAQAAKYVKVSDTQNALRLKFTAVSGATTYEATYRTWNGTTSGPRIGMTENIPSTWAHSAPGITLGVRYLLEVRAANDDLEVSNWSNRIDFTTAYDTAPPAAPIGYVDFTYDGTTVSWVVYARSDDINLSRLGVSGNMFYRDPYADFPISNGSQLYNPGDPPVNVSVVAIAENSTGQQSSTVISDSFSA